MEIKPAYNKTLWKRIADLIKEGAYIRKCNRMGFGERIFYKLFDKEHNVLRFIPEKTFNTLLRHRRIKQNKITGVYEKDPVWRKVRKDKKEKVYKRARKVKTNQHLIFSDKKMNKMVKKQTANNGAATAVA